MPHFYHELHNKANADYPYIQCDSRNLICLPHFHNELELAFVMSGQVQVICNGRKLTACAGELCIFMPGEIHKFDSPHENSVHVLKIVCKHSVERLDLTGLRFSNPISASSSLTGVVRQAILDIKREDAERAVGFGYAVEALTAQMIRHILRSGEWTYFEVSEQKKHAISLCVLEKANSYIENHYAEPVTLADAAAYCGFSTYYFAHLFKNATGTSFYHHLLSYRCDKAADFLNSGKQKITEIACECGFSDMRSFYRAFKKVFGKTPSAYRLRFSNRQI